jgi:hypothetical protein
MKRIVMILIAISVMSIAELANAEITDLPSYPRLATLINNYINSIDVAQADWIAEHNGYFQGLDLVDGQPNGVNNVKTDSTKMPTDQAFSWFDLSPQVFATSIALPVNIRVDVAQNGPDSSYTITFEFYRDLGQDAHGNVGNHWKYVYYVGPEPDPNAILNEWFVEDEGEA